MSHSHVERTLETFCNMNLEMQESQNIGKINKQVRQPGRGGARPHGCAAGWALGGGWVVQRYAW